jgi:hypothetical protein
MAVKKKIDISLMDKNEWCFSLKIQDISDVLNFEVFKNNTERLAEVGLGIKECVELKNAIDIFIKSQKDTKPKSKAGRKRIYEGNSETLSIHVPSDKKEFIKSVVDAILEPMKIKN